MSLYRFVYYSAVIGGWAALVGWLVAESLFLRSDANNAGLISVLFTGAAVGAAIGAGLNLAAGLSSSCAGQCLNRVLWGLGAGLLGGFLGILLGNGLFAIGLPRALGYTILGLGVGLADGLYDRSASKIRNGVIGGLLGGFVGGILFDPLGGLLDSSSGLASRATSFVVLGLAIGAMVGLVQVALKEAWLTVLDGYRPGRQHILSQPETSLGRADHLPLAFIGAMNQDLEPIHCRVVRKADGQYFLEALPSKLGVGVNHSPVVGTRRLQDGDVIKVGTNFVRFNERHKESRESSTNGSLQQPAGAVTKAPPPPPPPAKRASTVSSVSPPTPLPPKPQPPRPTAVPSVKASAPVQPIAKSASPNSALPPPPPPPARKS